MKLYYMPGACSIGIHVLLEEIGKPYDLHKIDGAKQEQYGEAFVKINPKSKVPTLQKDDGSVVTEFPAIATWLARKNPDKNLLPTDADGEASVLEALDYVVSTKSDHDKVKARGKEILEKGLALMDKKLEGKEYVAGKFSIADAALFYVEFWAAARMKLTLPKNCAAHYERMKNRPAVKRTIEQEGLQQAFA